MVGRHPTSAGRRVAAGALRKVIRTAAAGILVVVVAACTGSSLTLTSHDAGRTRASDPATSGDRDPRPEPAASSPETATATPVLNGRITSVQGHLRTHVSSYQWLAFDGGSDTGLVVSYRSCRHCRPRGIELARLTVLGPAGPVATLACSDRPPCRARVDGTAATLGPGADEVTVESGDRTIKVIGYDGTSRRTLDLTATLARGQDLRWLAWTPDGSRLLYMEDGATDQVLLDPMGGAAIKAPWTGMELPDWQRLAPPLASREYAPRTLPCFSPVSA